MWRSFFLKFIAHVRPRRRPFLDVVERLINEAMMGTHKATADDFAFLADVFLRSMRAHIAAARGFWDETVS